MVYNKGDRVVIKSWPEVKAILLKYRNEKESKAQDFQAFYTSRKKFCGKIFSIVKKEGWVTHDQDWYSLMDENGIPIHPHFSNLMFTTLKDKLDKILEEWYNYRREKNES